MRPPLLHVKPHGWDQDDLIRRLCHALDIAKLALEHLAPVGYVSTKDPSMSVRSEKVICETAVLLLHSSSVAGNQKIRNRVTCLAESLIPYARSERMLLGLCLEPSVAWDYALPHVCLKRLGYGDPQFDRLLSQSIGSQAHTGRERAPHRMLEQEWIASGWHESQGMSRSPNSGAAAISILNHPLDLFGGTREDIYAFTHAVMYVTDFNLRLGPAPRKRSMILSEAEVLLSRCLDDQDYDLGGEVLLSWPLTRKPWSPAAAFAFRVLAAVEDKTGFLPTPSTRITELDALEGRERTQHLLATAYHTAYVMGILCGASLRPGFAPPTTVPATKANRGAAKQLSEHLDLQAQSRHWQDVFREVTEPEADSLASFLLNVGLCRRIASRDFVGVRELLKLAYKLNLADTPAASQAAEMLERISTLSEITHDRMLPEKYLVSA